MIRRVEPRTTDFQSVDDEGLDELDGWTDWKSVVHVSGMSLAAGMSRGIRLSVPVVSAIPLTAAATARQ